MGNWKGIEKEIEECITVGGDFNYRTGELGGEELELEGTERRSKDKKIGVGGKNWIEWVQEKGWQIFNGRTEGDWDGEYTYVGARGNTMIDYMLVNDRMRRKVRRLEIEGRVESDHMPMVVTIKTREELRKETDKGKERNNENHNKVG